MADRAQHRSTARAGAPAPGLGGESQCLAENETIYEPYSQPEHYHPPTQAKGIKARSQHGDFARNWWAERWIDALEELVDPRRLGRGRSYARKGQVLSIEESKDGMEARVQGSGPSRTK